ncbi:MAG: hypothetical protein ACI4SR_03900 [Faecalibacillus sp.]
MSILVKNLNGRLIFIFNDQIQFDKLLIELKGLLKKSFFKHKDYFPKAFFDFKSRILSEEELIQLFDCLIETKCILFGGFVKDESNEEKHLNMIDRSIHAGEILYIHEDTLLTGSVNPGAVIYLGAKLYVLKGVYGTIEGIKENASICSKEYKNATIRFFESALHSFTSFTMCILYYKDNEIVCDREECVNV